MCSRWKYWRLKRVKKKSTFSLHWYCENEQMAPKISFHVLSTCSLIQVWYFSFTFDFVTSNQTFYGQRHQYTKLDACQSKSPFVQRSFTLDFWLIANLTWVYTLQPMDWCAVWRHYWDREFQFIKQTFSLAVLVPAYSYLLTWYW